MTAMDGVCDISRRPFSPRLRPRSLSGGPQGAGGPPSVRYAGPAAHQPSKPRSTEATTPPGRPRGMRSASCRSPCGNRPGASAISTRPSSSTCASPAAHSRIALCAAVCPCAWCAQPAPPAPAPRSHRSTASCVSRPGSGEEFLKRRLATHRARQATTPRPAHRHPGAGVAADPADPGNNSPLSPGLGQPHPARRLDLVCTAVIDVKQCH